MPSRRRLQRHDTSQWIEQRQKKDRKTRRATLGGKQVVKNLRSIATIALGPLKPYDVVQLEGRNAVGFQEKSIIKSQFVSIGTYLFSREILGRLPEKGSIQRTTFPRLASMRELKAYVMMDSGPLSRRPKIWKKWKKNSNGELGENSAPLADLDRHIVPCLERERKTGTVAFVSSKLARMHCILLFERRYR